MIVGRGSSFLVPLIDVLLYVPRMINAAGEETLALLSESDALTDAEQDALAAIISWCTGKDTDIELPEETDEAIPLTMLHLIPLY